MRGDRPSQGHVREGPRHRAGSAHRPRPGGREARTPGPPAPREADRPVPSAPGAGEGGASDRIGRAARSRRGPPVHSAAMSLFAKLLNAGEGRKLKLLQTIVPEVAAFEAEMEARSDEELRALTGVFKSRIDQGEDLDELLAEAFATVREAAKRVLGQRHFDVQVMGGAALHFGWIAEMKTGEGK